MWRRVAHRLKKRWEIIAVRRRSRGYIDVALSARLREKTLFGEVLLLQYIMESAGGTCYWLGDGT